MKTTLAILVVGVMLVYILGSRKEAAAVPTAEVPIAQDEYPILRVPTDPKAIYTILEHGGSAAKPTLVTKRVGSSGTSYAKRIFDCKAKTTKYLGTGDTLEDVKKSKPDPKMYALVEESIAWYQFKFACSNQDGAQSSKPSASTPQHIIANDSLGKALIAFEAGDQENGCAQLSVAVAVLLESKDVGSYKKVLKIKKDKCSND